MTSSETSGSHPRDAVRRPGESRSFAAERQLARLARGIYRGKSRAYGFCIWRDETDRKWVIEPHYGGADDKTRYAEWLLEHYMGLRGPHDHLRDARVMLVQALRDDFEGEVQD